MRTGDWNSSRLREGLAGAERSLQSILIVIKFRFPISDQSNEIFRRRILSLIYCLAVDYFDHFLRPGIVIELFALPSIFLSRRPSKITTICGKRKEKRK